MALTTTNIIFESMVDMHTRFEVEHKGYHFEISWHYGSSCWAIEGYRGGGRSLESQDDLWKRYNTPWQVDCFVKAAERVAKFFEGKTGLKYSWFVGCSGPNKNETPLKTWCNKLSIVREVFVSMGKTSSYQTQGKIFNTRIFTEPEDVNQFILANNCEWSYISYNEIPYHVAKCSDQGVEVPEINTSICDCGKEKHNFMTHIRGCPAHPDSKK